MIFDIWDDVILSLLVLFKLLLIDELNWLLLLNCILSLLFCEAENKLELLIFIFGIIFVVKFCLDIWALENWLSLSFFVLFILFWGKSFFCSCLTPKWIWPTLFGKLFGIIVLLYPKVAIFLFILFIAVLLFWFLSTSISWFINGFICFIFWLIFKFFPFDGSLFNLFWTLFAIAFAKLVLLILFIFDKLFLFFLCSLILFIISFSSWGFINFKFICFLTFWNWESSNISLSVLYITEYICLIKFSTNILTFLFNSPKFSKFFLNFSFCSLPKSLYSLSNWINISWLLTIFCIFKSSFNPSKALIQESLISLTEFLILFNDVVFTWLYSSINKLHFSWTFLNILNNSWNITEFTLFLRSDKSTDIWNSS